VRSLRTTKTFEKDFRRVAKQGRDMKRLTALIQQLIDNRPLSPLRRDHALVGNFGDCRECHLQAD